MVSDSKTSNGAGTGVFSSNLSGLESNTYYYVRAYAINNVGTAYGNEVTFTTLPVIELPTITTNVAIAIYQTSAISGGDILKDGWAPILARGVIWSTLQNPNITLNTKTNDGTGIGTFLSSIDGLISNTLYYCRAYATNSVGTSYGNEISFTTLPNIETPILSTIKVSSISQTSAISGGTISSDGWSAIISRGVVWSSLPNPTIDLLTKTSNGSGIGTYKSSLSGLNPNTTYHYRAYASNSSLTGYGDELSFTTIFFDPSKSLIQIGQVSSKDGVEIEIPIKMLNSLDTTNITGIDMDISFNSTMLFPLNTPIGVEIDGRRIISVSLPPKPLSSDNILKNIKMFVTFGNSDSTDLKIEKINPKGGNDNLLVQDGSFKLLGVCYEGGKRLINPKGVAKALAVFPNPSPDKISIKYESQKGANKLYVVNLLGVNVLDIINESSEISGLKTLEDVDISKLSDGVYFIILKNGNNIYSERLEKIR